MGYVTDTLVGHRSPVICRGPDGATRWSTTRRTRIQILHDLPDPARPFLDVLATPEFASCSHARNPFSVPRLPLRMDLYFSALDELIQIIYQGSAKFVLMSRVDYTSWTVHLGLSGPEGRWWRGKWTDEDIKAITVSSYYLSSRKWFNRSVHRDPSRPRICSRSLASASQKRL